MTCPPRLLQRPKVSLFCYRTATHQQLVAKLEQTRNKTEDGSSSTAAKLEAALREIDRLRCEMKNLHIKKEKQFSEIQKLQNIKEDNLAYSRELVNANQIIKERNYKIARLQQERSDNVKCVELLVVLQNKLAKVHKEKIYYATQDAKKRRMIENLKESLSALRETVAKFEESEKNKTGKYGDVSKKDNAAGIDNNVSKIQSTSFKEFVVAKREAAELRRENSLLQKELVRLKSEKETQQKLQ